MNILVVFDGTDDAVQNLQAALAEMKRNAYAQVRVCIPQILRDAIPSNAAVATMQEETHKAFARARQTLVDTHADVIGFALVSATDVDIADQIAQHAAQWAADVIYMSLGGQCEECQKIRQRRHFFTQRLTPVPTSPMHAAPAVAADMLNIAPCNLSVTCHREVVMTLQVVNHKQAVQSGSEEKAYQVRAS